MISIYLEVYITLSKINAIIMCIILIGTTGFAQEISKNKNNFIILDIQNNFDINTKLNPVEVIDQEQTLDSGSGCPFFDYLWIAQSFIPKMATITKVELKLFKENNPTNTVIVSIRSSLTDEDLTVVSRDASDITSSSKWIEFDFPDININPGETYFIVCKTPGGSATNYYCCMFYTNNPYPSGTVWGSLNYGVSWDIIEYPGYPDPDGCFITYGLDETPNIPLIDGPIKGNIYIDLTYKISTTDPDGDRIYYYTDWGDGTNSGWAGPYDSGFEISMIHFWNEKNSYIIKVKAKDKYGVESDWTTLNVVIPRNKIITNLLSERFLQNHPILILYFQKFFRK